MSKPDSQTTTLHHGTTVSIDGHAVLIEGPSGSGKSTLAVQLMALGARLVADDSTRLRHCDDAVWAEAPETLPAAIEVRGIGLIRAELAAAAPLALIIDLTTNQTDRLPAPAHRDIFGHKVALLNKIDGAHFSAAILQYVRGRGVLDT